MPKITLAAFAGVKTKGAEGVFSIYGRDGAGRDIEVEIPLGLMTRLASETRRAALARPRPTSIPANANPGEWSEVQPLDIRGAAVGTLQPPAGPAVGLVFDPGADTELAFRLTAQNAQELGKLLLNEGDKLKDTPPPPSLRGN